MSQSSLQHNFAAAENGVPVSHHSTQPALQGVNSSSVREPMSRRRFLQLAAAGVIAPSIILPSRITRPRAPSLNVPSHLPERLAICYYGWGWITTALPDEAFGDLDRAVKETKERGFNCVRAEMGLNWMFDLQGRRRGKIHFTDWVPGFSSNLQCVNGKGGAEFDVFDRVMELFEIAAKHEVYVIMTSWEYQDAISQLADDGLREEILSVPYSDRLKLLAEQYDRLLRELQKRGLHKRIAQVEVINELNTPPIVCSPSPVPPETMAQWTHRMSPAPPCSKSAVRQLAFDAVQFLRQRHPSLLITVDGLVACSTLDPLFPENAQVADHHVYSDGVVQAFWKKCGLNGFGPGSPLEPKKNPFLKSVLKPDPASWEDFVKKATHVRQEWWGIGWLYANLDNRKFDDWCVSHFSEYEQTIKQSLEKQFECAARFARPRGLPLVVDEGFILYPPLNSRFVTTPQGRRGEEYGVNAAIATGHWGIIPSAYFRPDTPIWADDSQCAWARKMNQRIIGSA